jgi:hypothetical protein
VPGLPETPSRESDPRWRHRHAFVVAVLGCPLRWNGIERGAPSRSGSGGLLSENETCDNSRLSQRANGVQTLEPASKIIA